MYKDLKLLLTNFIILFSGYFVFGVLYDLLKEKIKKIREIKKYGYDYIPRN
jgi:hypothetical protein